MNKLKSKKGITLVALVVTIVVLLILAGVSINLVLGNNGIIAKAKEVQRKSAEATQNDLIGMNELAQQLEGQLNGSTGSGSGGTGGETQTPEVAVGEIKVVADSTGTGSAITDANSVYLGNTLYITFSHSITGGTTAVDKTIPYAVTKNGTYTFTVTGTVNGKSCAKEVSVTINQFKDVYEYMPQNTPVTYPDGVVWIPEGFKVADDSAKTVQGGVVIEDKDGNQFVWVPVATIGYGTRWYTGIEPSSAYLENLSEDEKISVETYKGFYIGRYEAGDKENTEAKTLRSSNDVTKTATIKANQAPYNYVTRTQAVSLAEGFATKQGYKAKTKLVSSYAWDTTIEFIQKVNSDYGNSSEEGNYYDTTFSYTDIKGAKQTKAKDSSVLVPTGQTTPVCNIYDMGGNVWEWTTESCLTANLPYVKRGGVGKESFADYPFGYPAGYRFCDSDDARDDCGFRLTLFM